MKKSKIKFAVKKAMKKHYVKGLSETGQFVQKLILEEIEKLYK